jgi:hypothetical protein
MTCLDSWRLRWRLVGDYIREFLLKEKSSGTEPSQVIGDRYLRFRPKLYNNNINNNFVKTSKCRGQNGMKKIRYV